MAATARIEAAMGWRAAGELFGTRSTKLGALMMIRELLLLANVRVGRRSTRTISFATMRAKVVTRAERYEVRLHLVVDVEHFTDGLAINVVTLARFR